MAQGVYGSFVVNSSSEDMRIHDIESTLRSIYPEKNFEVSIEAVEGGPDAVSHAIKFTWRERAGYNMLSEMTVSDAVFWQGLEGSLLRPAADDATLSLRRALNEQHPDKQFIIFVEAVGRRTKYSWRPNDGRPNGFMQ